MNGQKDDTGSAATPLLSGPVHTWKVTIEWTGNDEGFGDDITTLSQTGSWDHDRGKRSAMECMILDLAYLCRMLADSGHVVFPPSVEDMGQAWDNAWS